MSNVTEDKLAAARERRIAQGLAVVTRALAAWFDSKPHAGPLTHAPRTRHGSKRTPC
jgi:hypothetical protein